MFNHYVTQILPNGFKAQVVAFSSKQHTVTNWHSTKKLKMREVDVRGENVTSFTPMGIAAEKSRIPV